MVYRMTCGKKLNEVGSKESDLYEKCRLSSL